MGRCARAIEMRRLGAVCGVALLSATLAGCDKWEWSFETNGIGLTESIAKKLSSFLSGNTIVNPGGGVGVGISTGGPTPGGGTGGGGGGGGGGSGGGGGGLPGPDQSAQVEEEEEIEMPGMRGERVLVTVAGRAWGMVESAMRVEADHVVLEAVLEARGEGAKGVFGTMRVRVPRAEWPDASEGSDEEAAWPARESGDGVRPKDAPTLPLTWEASREGLELAGARYEGTYHASRLVKDRAREDVAAVKGTIDMLAQRAGASAGTQWVRVRALGAARNVASATR